MNKDRKLKSHRCARCERRYSNTTVWRDRQRYCPNCLRIKRAEERTGKKLYQCVRCLELWSTMISWADGEIYCEWCLRDIRQELRTGRTVRR